MKVPLCQVFKAKHPQRKPQLSTGHRREEKEGTNAAEVPHDGDVQRSNEVKDILGEFIDLLVSKLGFDALKA